MKDRVILSVTDDEELFRVKLHFLDGRAETIVEAEYFWEAMEEAIKLMKETEETMEITKGEIIH